MKDSLFEPAANNKLINLLIPTKSHSHLKHQWANSQDFIIECLMVRQLLWTLQLMKRVKSDSNHTSFKSSQGKNFLRPTPKLGVETPHALI